VAFTTMLKPIALLAALATSLAGGASAHADEQQTLAGDLGGIRTAFAAAGLALGASYVGETLGVVSGGVKRGFIFEGQVALSLDADLETVASWRGATAHVSAFDLHGRGPSADFLGGNLMDVSNIEARREARLYTLWLEQSLADGRVAVRAGQLAADDEFLISDTAGNLLNGTFGWPTLTAADTIQGGAAYPLAAPGMRVRARPLRDVTLLAGVFAGNPGGEGCAGDPQICNKHGTTFSLSDGALWMAELQLAAKLGASELPGTYKFGAWRETGAFPNQRTGAKDRHGDYGVYAVGDQMVWRVPGDGERGLSVFLRGGAAPDDRNFVSWYVDGGFGFKGPVEGRPDDVASFGVAYAGISDDASARDRLAGLLTPVRDYEAAIELTYSVRLRPGWTVQPDLQYVIHPGGNVAHPLRTGTVADALVLGLRTAITF
jgi:porin